MSKPDSPLASKVLMIRPVGFKKNRQTISDNQFQSQDTSLASEVIEERALKEFDELKLALKKHGIDCLVFDPENPKETPDAVFPNNWISFHKTSNSINKDIFLYPMLAENRRLERSLKIVENLNREFGPYEILDLSWLEQKNQFLEGTGSLVFDRERKKAYACLSERTTQSALIEFAKKSGFSFFSFKALDPDRKAIYHTNVMMSLGLSCAVYAEEFIEDESERAQLRTHLKKDFSHHVLLDWHQVKNFCGNIILLSNKKSEPAWFMSTRAADSFTPTQRAVLEKDGPIITAKIDTIEDIGGGGLRCMIAEIF